MMTDIQPVALSKLAGREVRIPRGRGPGGSSTINGVLYVRGHAGGFPPHPIQHKPRPAPVLFRCRGVLPSGARAAQLDSANASVVPRLMGANTNIPTVMIAEKATDMIIGKPPLAPPDASPGR